METKRINTAAIHDIRTLRALIERKRRALDRANAGKEWDRAARIYEDIQTLKGNLKVVTGRLYV